MPSFEPNTLAAWTGGRWTGPLAAPPVGFSVDTRRLSAGQAFVALRTVQRDGHDFLAAALNAGAACAIVSRPVPRVALPQLVVDDPLAALQAVARQHRRTYGGPVVGITGSAGKTSTKELLALLLGGEAGGVLSTEGNLNNQIGVALTLTRLDPAGHRCAVVEAGISAPGEMQVLAGMIEPDIAVVTLVGPAHLEELGGLAGVAREKAVLAGGVRKAGMCVFPADCEAYPEFQALAAVCTVIEPAKGRGPLEGRIRFAVSHTSDGTRISIAPGLQNPFEVALRRVSNGMAQNVALAAAAALKIGVRSDEIQHRMLSWRASPLRGEWRASEGRRLYLDCYNANPASMADALEAFYAIAPEDEPRLLVIGCMEELGGDSARYHLELGRSLVLRRGDHAVVVGGHAGAVRQGAIEGGCRADQVEVADAVEQVSMRLAGFRGSVFMKGSRRHELERALAGAEFAEAPHA